MAVVAWCRFGIIAGVSVTRSNIAPDSECGFGYLDGVEKQSSHQRRIRGIPSRQGYTTNRRHMD
jgi:hypothetical protein